MARGKAKPTPVVVKQARVKKEKKVWTKESAEDYVRKSRTKGLTYWSASDYLKKVHNINTEK